MTRRLTLQRITPLNHSVFHLVFDRPEGLAFTPGQAVDMALDRDGWRETRHPFTFTSLPSEEAAEFVIKTYPEDAEGHEGMTARIAQMQPGDAVLVEDPWGAIKDEGDGLFLAGGAGVTPFIAVLRDKLARAGTLEGNTLIFSNETEQDIFLKAFFEDMPGLRTRFIVTQDKDSALYHPRIDSALLKDYLQPDRDTCYVCGPDAMLEDMSDLLRERGVPADRIVTEDFD